MRIVQLTSRFYSTRRLHAPHGSAAANALRPVFARLGDARVALPLAGDVEDFRTPFSTTWAHVVPEARLVLTYTFHESHVDVLEVRPAWQAV